MGLITIGRGELFARIALAILLGSLIGLERERGERAAGMRTHALVCLGSTVFMLVSAYGVAALVGSSATPNSQSALRIDPFRLAAQVVSGIGFLGAGAIFFRREIVRGLTTAAGLWVVAGIGLAVGAGMYLVSIGATVASLVVLAGFKPIEDRLIRRPQRLIINVRPTEGQLPAVRHAFERSHVRLLRLSLLAGDKVKQETIRAYYSPASGANIEQLVELLRTVPGFLSIDQLTVLMDGSVSSNGYDTEEATVVGLANVAKEIDDAEDGAGFGRNAVEESEAVAVDRRQPVAQVQVADIDLLKSALRQSLCDGGVPKCLVDRPLVAGNGGRTRPQPWQRKSAFVAVVPCDFDGTIPRWVRRFRSDVVGDGQSVEETLAGRVAAFGAGAVVAQPDGGEGGTVAAGPGYDELSLVDLYGGTVVGGGDWIDRGHGVFLSGRG